MDQIFLLVLFALILAVVFYAFNKHADEAVSGDELLEVPSPSSPAAESNIQPPAQHQKARKVPPVKSAKKTSKKAAKKNVKKPRNRREL